MILYDSTNDDMKLMFKKFAKKCDRDLNLNEGVVTFTAYTSRATEAVSARLSTKLSKPHSLLKKRNHLSNFL